MDYEPEGCFPPLFFKERGEGHASAWTGGESKGVTGGESKKDAKIFLSVLFHFAVKYFLPQPLQTLHQLFVFHYPRPGKKEKKDHQDR